MKQNQLFAILALMLALGIPIPAVLFATGADGNLSSTSSKAKAASSDGEGTFDGEKSQSADEPTLVLTEAELFSALEDPKISHIALAEHIIVQRDLVFNRDFSINLNGHNIISCGNGSKATLPTLNPRAVDNARVIDIVSGHVEITGAGHIMALGADSAAVRIRGATDADQKDFASITIGPDVILNAPNYYGLFVTPNFNAAYGVTVNFAGTMIARDGFCVNSRISRSGENVPVINILDGAKIIVDELNGTAIYAAGFGNWNIGAAELTGASGLTVKSGTLTLTGTHIQALGAFQNLESDNAGVGAAVQIEESDPYIGNIHLTINSGEYVSERSYVFAKYHTDTTSIESLRSLTIEDGKFVGNQAVLQGNGIFYGLPPHDAEHDVALILGGEFNSDISDYLAPGYHIEKDSILRTYTVIDEAKPLIAPPNPAELLATAESELNLTIEMATHYIASDYAGNELGDLQTTVNKITAATKRALRSAKRLINSTKEVSLDQLKAARKKLIATIDDFQKVEDDLRADILSGIAAARAIDPNDFSEYSYNLLMESVVAADKLLLRRGITLQELYSIYCDIELNTELLEDSDEENTSLAGFPESPADKTAPALDLPAAVAPSLDLPAPAVPNLDLPLPPAPEISALPKLPVIMSREEELAEIAEQVDIESVTAIVQATLLAELGKPKTVADDTVLDQIGLLASLESAIDPESELAVAPAETEAVESEIAETDSLLLDAELASDDIANDFTAPVVTTMDTPLESPAPSTSSTSPTSSSISSVSPNPELVSAAQDLRQLLNAVSALNPEEYTVESYAGFTGVVSRAGELLNSLTYDTAPVALTTAFNNVNLAYSQLVKRPNNPTTLALENSKANLAATLQVVQALTVNDYRADAAEQFGELQVAIARANAVLGHETILPEEIMSVMEEIRLATSGLKSTEDTNTSAETATGNQPTDQVDLSTLTQVISQISQLEPNEFTAESYSNVINVLEQAKAILAQSFSTQGEINHITSTLISATRALIRVPAPAMNYYGGQATVTSAPYQANSAQPTPNLIAGTTPDPNITPSWLMSMMAGAYAGLATYRKSREEAKQRKLSARLSKRMLYQK